MANWFKSDQPQDRPKGMRIIVSDGNESYFLKGKDTPLLNNGEIDFFTIANDFGESFKDTPEMRLRTVTISDLKDKTKWKNFQFVFNESTKDLEITPL